jgi:hypothetical protein
MVPASLGYFSTSLFLNANSYTASIYATAVDSAGDLYVTGQVGSGSLATTPGSLETSGNGSFVAKLSPSGAVVYATYLGTGGGAGTGIAVDSAGDAYVIGADSGVPTTANAIATSGGADFVAELNPTGSGLLYGTYLPSTVNCGNYASGYVSAIAVDGSGNIYVDGAAQAGFPTTAGAYQTAASTTDAFFAKIDPALSGTASLLYSSYFGGGGGAAATGIALDGAGNAYLEGYTGHAPVPGGILVAKIDPALSGAASLVYSTYLSGGGNGYSGYVGNEPFISGVPEIDGGIAVDSAGNAYVTSATSQTNFPTTAGAYQTTFNNKTGTGEVRPSDVVVAKLNAAGSLVYSTYLGGGTVNGLGTSSGGASIAVDASGDAYVTGWTDSTTFPTKNPTQATNGDAGAFDGSGDGMDSFVTELNSSGSGLVFSTYLGSSYEDYDGYGIALDSAGNVYVGGGIDPANGTNSQTIGFAAKINLAPSPSFSVAGFPSSTTAGVAHTFTVTALNADGTVNTNYTGTVQFTSSDPQAGLPANYTFTAADQGVHTFTVTIKTAGTQSITATDTATGSITGSESGITVNPAAASTLVIGGLPSSVTQGTAYTFTVTALDPYGNVATGYTGTVHFSSSDSAAKLPANYTFTAADAGMHKFSVTFNTVGTESLTVTDTLYASISGIDTGITVTKRRH